MKGEGHRVRGAETKRGSETGGFCGGEQGDRGWPEGSVSALRLPDAPNIMFNDINFLLNGPRFDSRCERVAPSPSSEPQLRTEAGKSIPRRIIWRVEYGKSEKNGKGKRRMGRREKEGGGITKRMREEKWI